MDSKYDSVLLGILQHEGKIQGFLDVILGFLYRRTDFYRILTSKDTKMGFPPGTALKMLTQTFHQYDQLTRRDDERREQAKSHDTKVVSNSTDKTENSANKTKCATEASKSETGAKSKPETGAKSETNTGAKSETNNLPSSGSKCNKTNTDSKHYQNSGDNSENSTTSDNAQVCEASSEDMEMRDNEEGKDKENDDDPELTRQQQAFQNNPESYNGAEREGYSWAQSITDVDVRVKVPSYIKKGRDVKVDVAKKHIKVAYKDETNQWMTMLDGDLIWEVDKEESMWTLNPGENVHINFEKKEERWWDSLITSEPKISVRKIDASRPMTDLDDEAQAKIEEMMYNDRRKKMGLPTSQEQKVQDMLRNAWDADGSPFKGTQFDPSQFSMDPNGVINMKPPS